MRPIRKIKIFSNITKSKFKKKDLVDLIKTGVFFLQGCKVKTLVEYINYYDYQVNTF